MIELNIVIYGIIIFFITIGLLLVIIGKWKKRKKDQYNSDKGGES